MKANFNVDFILSLGIFFTGLFLFYTVIPNIHSSTYIPDSKKILAYEISEKLVNSPGEPKDWRQIDDVSSLGLAYYDGFFVYPNILDLQKLNQLDRYNCSLLKEKVGINTEFSIEVIAQGYHIICENPHVNQNRYIERIIRVTPNGVAYLDGVLKVYV